MSLASWSSKSFSFRMIIYFTKSMTSLIIKCYQSKILKELQHWLSLVLYRPVKMNNRTDLRLNLFQYIERLTLNVKFRFIFYHEYTRCNMQIWKNAQTCKPCLRKFFQICVNFLILPAISFVKPRKRPV